MNLITNNSTHKLDEKEANVNEQMKEKKIDLAGRNRESTTLEKDANRARLKLDAIQVESRSHCILPPTYMI